MAFGSTPRQRRLMRRLTWLPIPCLLLAGIACAYVMIRGADSAARPATATKVRSDDATSGSHIGLGDLFARRGGAVQAAPLVRVRDSTTGRALEADMVLQSLARADHIRQAKVQAAGDRLAALPAGDYAFSATAPGYAPLATQLHVGKQRALPLTFWLAPEQPSTVLERRALKALECGACSVVSGNVYDRTSGKPLSGLRVVADQGAQAVTDADGGFELLLVTSVQTLADVEALPASTAITISGAGYRQSLTGIALYNDSTHLILDLDRGGSPRQDLQHVQMRVREQGRVRAQPGQGPVAVALEAERIAAGRGQALDPREPRKAELAQRLAAQAATVPVPASIRVGTGCSGRSCSGVSVYAFEDYVGRGLDDEWIASWQAASLAAGAIAYRSYGAYYVANPVSSQYDICSSTSCQVFRSGSVSATIAAAAATRDVVLTRDGQTVAFSEYSAENNAWDDPTDGLSCSNPDLSCGNSANGSPAKQWPCLSDSVGRGRGCFGHGRGMSQWGTQRWAANHGRDWQWITNHYYNANNQPGGMRNAFLANLGSGGGTTMLDNFESDVGHFNTSPTYSGSTTGISTASTATRNCGTSHAGACSLQVKLVDDSASAASWAVRLLSGAGNPAANVPLARTGKIGFWVYAAGSGMQVAVGIDDSDGTERSSLRSLAANTWTYVEWTLADAAQWNAWAGNSNGAITAATVKLDAVWFFHANTSYTVNVYVDNVQYKH